MTDAVARAHRERSGGAEGGAVVVGREGRTSQINSDLVVLGLAGILGILSLEVLAGWVLDLPQLGSWLPSAVEMKVNAAICVLALAAALGVIASPLPERLRRPIAAGLSLLVVAIAGATLIEHLGSINLGIDQALFVDKASAGSPHPGRFAVQTSMAFLSAAAAVPLMGRRTFRGLYPSEVLGVLVGCVGGIGLLGYMFGASELLSLGSATQVSLPASVALALLGPALVAENPDHRLVRVLTDPGAAGQVIRVFLPTALLVVPASAWIRLWGERAGLYDESIGLTLMVAFEAAILTAIGAWTTFRIQRLEAERAEARRDTDRFFELTTDLVCVADGAGRLVVVSPSWEQVLGFPISEIASRPFIDFVHADDRERTIAEFGSELGGGQVHAFQNRYRTADGGYRWLEWNSMPDATTGRMYAVARDVTQRRQAEEDLARLAAIVEFERRWHPGRRRGRPHQRVECRGRGVVRIHGHRGHRPGPGAHRPGRGPLRAVAAVE